MKTRMYNIRFFLLAVIMVFFTINADLHGQTSHASCNLVKIGNTDFPVTVNLYGIDGKPITSIKSGLDFNLSITLPGGVCGSGEDSPLYSIQIIASGYHHYVRPSPLGLGKIPAGLPQFSQTGYQQPYINTTEIRSDKGRAINVPFHFLAGSTCDGEVGEFDVTVSLTCGNKTYYCNLKVDLKAEAKNYWKVTKEHYWGNLRGGVVVWKIIIENKNLTPGIGDLNIVDGNITDRVLPGTIISVEPLSLFPYTPSVTWKITNTILSTAQPVVYYVRTYSCDPAGTLVRNCVDYEFCLGKRYENVIITDPDSLPGGGGVNGITPDKKENSTKTGKNIVDQTGIIIPPTITYCCEKTDSSSCDTVRLVAGPSYNTNFGKSLTYASNLNYAQGCEGEYSIVVSNSGNVPLTNLWLTDYYMAYKDGVLQQWSFGINVTRITIVGYGVNMDYFTNLDPTGTTCSSPYNFSNSCEWNFSKDFPTSLELKTTSGELEGGYIVIRIRFTITAEAGIVVRNSADLVYNGTFKGWGNWCSLPLPPDTLIKTKHADVDFKVEEARSVPGVVKCIPSGQQSYMINDEIVFRIVVSNHGQGNLSGTLKDPLSSPQDLELVPGSVIYYWWGSAAFNPYTTIPACIDGSSLDPPHNIPSSSPPGWLTETSSSSQNLTWNLNDMPGRCESDTANYLVIEYRAKVKPQSFGNYKNEAILVTPTVTPNSFAYYNIMREDIIEVTKQVSTQYAEPGQQFEYTIVVKNGGTIELGNIQVKDQLPACVTLNTKSAKGPGGQNITTIGPAPGTSMYSFPGIFIKPEEKIELVLRVTRTATGQNPCCNPLATGYGVPFINGKGQGFTIQDSDGPVCVESGLCCDMEFVNVGLQSNILYPGNLVLRFTVSGGVKPIIEADIDLLDYHVRYNQVACKPLNIGNLTGHIRPVSTSPIGGVLNLTGPSNPPAVNNTISWAALAGSSLMFNNQVIQIYFVRPSMLNIWCCDGTVYYCFKVRLKDLDCNVCEKIVCGSAPLSNPSITNTNIQWVSPEAKDAYILESLENAVPEDNLQLKDSNPDFIKLK